MQSHGIPALNDDEIEFVFNRVNDRFHESGKGIGYLVTRVVLGGDDNLLRTPFSSLVGKSLHRYSYATLGATGGE